MESPLGLEIDTSPERAVLLREAVELLLSEIAVVSLRQWDDLPELKKKKVVLASRLRALAPITGRRPLDGLRSLVPKLEIHSRRQIEAELEFMGRQILALQELSQYGRECLNISFEKFC
jgi:hypothetical protein